LPHPAETWRQLADRHRPRGGLAGRRVEVTRAAAARKAVCARHLGPGAGAGPVDRWGITTHRTRIWCLLFAPVLLATVAGEGEGEVHGLAPGGAVITPAAGQAGDQPPATAGLPRPWPVHPHPR